MIDFLILVPEIALVVLAAFLIVADLSLKDEQKSSLNTISLIGFVAVFVLILIFGKPNGTESIWGGMLKHDWLAYTFRLIFTAGAALTVVFARGWKSIHKRGEFYTLLTISTLGMTLMAAAGDIVMLFLAIETASIPLYVLAGFSKTDEKSVESGIKYLLFGAATSAVMLYGFSLLYGFTGTTNLYEMAAVFTSGSIAQIPLVGVIILILVGFGFKISIFPFHFWAPDVYEGAPTPITGFLSTASKAAGFSVLMRVMLVAFPMSLSGDLQMMFAILSAVTMTFGNLVALRQTNIKRMLAYSSIAHAGYILMGLAAGSALGLKGMTYYIVVYVITNLAAFGFVIIYSKKFGTDEIKDYAGFSRRSAGLALGMMFIFLSLGGIPPLGGFIAKTLVFAAAVESGLVWLAVIGVINAVIALYYYLNVLKYVWLYRQEGDEEPWAEDKVQSTTLMLSVALVLILGIVIAPVLDWMSEIASVFF
jgi:NADH-quinone oxidoreductase subunit N